MSIARLLAGVLVSTILLASPAAVADPWPDEDALVAAAPPAREIAAETFDGGQRLVTGTVQASMPASRRGSKMLLILTLRCGTEVLRNSQNVARGTTATLTPRLLVPDARACSLWAQSVALGGPPDEELLVSGVLRAGPEVIGGRGYSPGGQPVRITAGEALEVVPVMWTVPDGVRLLAVVGDVKTTTCTVVGGSRENGSPYLCEHHVDPAGSSIRVSVEVEYPGSLCPVLPVAVRDVFVDPVRHHVMTYQAGVVPVLRLCGSTVRVAVVVQALSGSDLVVHAQGTVAAVMSRAS
jgi:hypothetical protein